MTKKDTYDFILDSDSGRIQVFYTTVCGREDHVAEILEPFSDDPGLELHVPLSFNGVRRILKGITGWREACGM